MVSYMCRRRCWLVLTPLCIIISLLCVAVAVSLLLLYFIYFSSLEAFLAEKSVTIVPGHTTFDQLKEPTLPVYKDIYFYNLTNPEEFHNGARPIVEEIGPYSYREYRRKFFNQSDLLANQTFLQYTQLKTFHFSPETSLNRASEDDIICTVNIPYVGAVAQVLSIEGFLKRAASILYLNRMFKHKNAKLYVCVPPTQLAFNYTDPLIQELHDNSELNAMNMNLPTNYISIQQNASINDSSPSIIYTGVSNINDVGKFHQWDGLTDLGDRWPGATANDINGTEGLVFPPNLKEGDNLTVFIDDALRSFPVEYTGKQTIMGLETYRYMLPSSVFESAFTNPENARWGSWCPNGLIYLGVLQKPNVPIFGSKPRFLDCDPEETIGKINGVPKPDRELDTYMYVHPLIGVNVQFQRSLQLNLQINRTSYFKPLSHIDGTMYYPIMYINENSNLTDEFKTYLMNNGLILTELVPILVPVVFVVLIILSIIALFVSVVGCKKLHRYRRLQGYEEFAVN